MEYLTSNDQIPNRTISTVQWHKGARSCRATNPTTTDGAHLYKDTLYPIPRKVQQYTRLNLKEYEFRLPVLYSEAMDHQDISMSIQDLLQLTFNYEQIDIRHDTRINNSKLGRYIYSSELIKLFEAVLLETALPNTEEKLWTGKSWDSNWENRSGRIYN